MYCDAGVQCAILPWRTSTPDIEPAMSNTDEVIELSFDDGSMYEEPHCSSQPETSK